MRISVTLEFPSHSLLPWNYINSLRGIIYHAMSIGAPRVAQFVHDVGFTADGKQFKLLTFSLLEIPRATEKQVTQNGIRIRGIATWYISSPVAAFIEALTLGLLSKHEWELAGNVCHVVKIQVEHEPEFNSRMQLMTLSPITASTGTRAADGKFIRIFLSPEHPNFVRVLNQNLKRKAKAIGMKLDEHVELAFQFHEPYRSKLLTVNDTDVRGWMMKFTVEGPIELIKLGYDAGFGERNAQGFGMVKVARAKHEGKRADAK